MKVLVDIGNTRTKYLIEQGNGKNIRGITDNKKITEHWLSKYWDIASHLMIASVKSGLLTELISRWAGENKVDVSFIESEKKRFGITNSYQQPKTLGVDRWLTLVGASSLFPNSGVIIIDAGTATTLDVLDENGMHQGGWILSGIDLLLSQLNNNTSKVLFEVSELADTGFGQSTSECVNNAAWAATIGMINTGIIKAKNTYNIKHCILLGGNAARVELFIEFTDVQIINDLIFEGLKRY